MESSFAIVAEPNRRAILSLLLSSERSVGELERKLRLSQPSVSKHLRVLREAGFVDSRIEAQRRLYRLRPEPLRELDAWLVPFRRFWLKHVDALEQHLDRMETVPALLPAPKIVAPLEGSQTIEGARAGGLRPPKRGGVRGGATGGEPPPRSVKGKKRR